MKIAELIAEKAKDTKIVVQNVKPRDPNHAILAAKKNAGGAMRDKKQELKRGETKHKGRAFEASLGSRIDYDSYKAWKDDLPKKSTFHKAEHLERAQAAGKDFDGVAGTWDHDKKTGWIYAYYLKKDNLSEALSAVDRKAILADFKEWTGGFDPQETTEREIKRYVQTSMDSSFDEAEVLRFLTTEHDAVNEGRRNVYGKGDEALLNHPNKTMQKIGKGEEVKVMTKSGVAKIEKVQFYNGGSMYKLDREVKLNDGSKGQWVSDREVSFDLDKGAAPSAKTFAHRQAVGEELLAEGWMNHKDGSFSADMSEISHHKKDAGRDPKCPICKKIVNLSKFDVKKDNEGDVQFWHMTHECGAKLKIWND